MKLPSMPLVRIGLTLAALAGAACAGGAQIGEKAPDFTLTDLAGKVHRLSDYAGKTVVLEWFNPGCPYCVAVYKGGVVADTLASIGAAEGKVVYLAINSTAQGVDHPQQVVDISKKFLAETGVDVPVLIDFDGAVARAYDAKTTPHTFVIDGKGLLRYEGAYTSDNSGKNKDATNYVNTTVAALAAGNEVEPTSVKPWGCSIKFATLPEQAEVGKPAPAFSATDITGKTRSLAEFRGRTVVLEWYNPGCPYCVAVYKNGVVAKTLAGLAAIGSDQVYLAINSTGNAPVEQVTKESAALLAESKIDVPVLLDHDGAIGKRYDARTTPHIYVIDALGILRYAGAYTSDSKDADATNYALQAAKQIASGETVEPTFVKPWGCSVKYAKPKN